ncbi:hypothetical protein GDO78_020841 [Eleutherodactylus coqui]|uniref:Uncharacterized protein n=1 Tax=Eleutherodactylus coqui TaxID=57060 RepID=A0A8J6BJE6_ELECQ|nr:hypothetical protein GDO78_020841 [Eleutherodactylus coqui]
MKSTKCFFITGFLSRVRFREENLVVACCLLLGSVTLGERKGKGATQLLESSWVNSLSMTLRNSMSSLAGANLLLSLVVLNTVDPRLSSQRKVFVLSCWSWCHLLLVSFSFTR